MCHSSAVKKKPSNVLQKFSTRTISPIGNLPASLRILRSVVSACVSCTTASKRSSPRRRAFSPNRNPPWRSAISSSDASSRTCSVIWRRSSTIDRTTLFVRVWTSPGWSTTPQTSCWSDGKWDRQGIRAWTLLWTSCDGKDGCTTRDGNLYSRSSPVVASLSSGRWAWTCWRLTPSITIGPLTATIGIIFRALLFISTTIPSSILSPFSNRTTRGESTSASMFPPCTRSPMNSYTNRGRRREKCRPVRSVLSVWTTLNR